MGRVRSKSCGLISSRHYSNIKKGAKQRGIGFALSVEQIWNLAEEQDFQCALSGLDLNFNDETTKSGEVDHNFVTASLDRIDSEKDYTIENVQWVHKHINRAKMHMTDEDFIEMCRAVADHNKKEESEDSPDDTQHNELNSLP